ncbi:MULTISPECIES: histidine phosphatase family protein [Subtercola]|uniref:Histidine phosphatase family protein n=1 Tax=Subtercola vilae TaxID=2056433 RepID=A0A4T2C4M8_9MICO|nr:MULTISPECIES: histidine phosphatase family protein [Subtercola]MEA9986218.1 histidine phosphatase family protein [Subtercola sp. RTI3]TIH39047.1 histidine phosphatase family protein [Subtercola vilae]
MRLLLIRHGQTIDNVNGALGTVIPGPGLTELGRRQAAAVPEALSSQPIDAIYVSSMKRTHETAAPLANARGLEVRQLDGLQEISAGSLESRTDTEAIHQYMGTIFSWWQSFDGRIPGGEDGHEFYGRYGAAIGEAAAGHPETATVAVVSHGAAIRAWSSFASANIDADFSRAHELSNTAVVVLEGSPDAGWVTTYWDGQPIGGSALDDATAPDPTADALD